MTASFGIKLEFLEQIGFLDQKSDLGQIGFEIKNKTQIEPKKL